MAQKPTDSTGQTVLGFSSVKEMLDSLFSAQLDGPGWTAQGGVWLEDVKGLMIVCQNHVTASHKTLKWDLVSHGIKPKFLNGLQDLHGLASLSNFSLSLESVSRYICFILFQVACTHVYFTGKISFSHSFLDQLYLHVSTKTSLTSQTRPGSPDPHPHSILSSSLRA